MRDREPVRVICGPTGAGKTALLLRLAEVVGAPSLRVIGADSRQVYRGFVIGTAAPSPDERRRVPHALVNVIDPRTRFTAAHWAEAARAAIDAAHAEGAVPVVVGGTGFYLRALETPLFAEPPLDERQRAQLRIWMRARSHDEITRWADRLDPGAAHPGRAQRERAVEMALLTGRPLSDWRRDAAVSEAVGVTLRTLVIDPGPALAEQLEARTIAMCDSGWLAEVDALMQTVPEAAPAWLACGYLALRDVVAGRRRLDDALEAVRIETRQYVKRQRTWFRHQLRNGTVTRLDPSAPDALARAIEWWHGGASVPHEAP
ncbi:MAG: tRNA (adenosine(37)-N6)-dimethylallyltransferase MiaA [Gemmatimonadaceae bacterium]|nr:tRNA (adenosine(37)-N6)-dimethylallyltransferase MiaA [Gemmatimonadaceae bacterium]